MRLTSAQVEAIQKATTDIFGPEAQVWLFGSRVDDNRRGGDIDLMIDNHNLGGQSLARAKIRFLSRLKMLLGDQRIDLITTTEAGGALPIHQVARKTGVRL